MRRHILAIIFLVFPIEAFAVGELPPLKAHPDTAGWQDLFAPDLSNADKAEGVWRFEGGVLTASKDEPIWTKKDYENFVVDVEFKNAPGTNSGVVVYCSDPSNWIPSAIEIQIADDSSEDALKWAPTWRCGAVFGHLAPSRPAVKPPGEWNRYTIRCVGPRIEVVLNGEPIIAMDMREWTSAKTNPDGSEIPPWLSRPLSELPTKGRIGLQGQHGGAPIWFRNMKLKELD